MWPPSHLSYLSHGPRELFVLEILNVWNTNKNNFWNDFSIFHLRVQFISTGLDFTVYCIILISGRHTEVWYHMILSYGCQSYDIIIWYFQNHMQFYVRTTIRTCQKQMIVSYDCDHNHMVQLLAQKYTSAYRPLCRTRSIIHTKFSSEKIFTNFRQTHSEVELLNNLSSLLIDVYLLFYSGKDKFTERLHLLLYIAGWIFSRIMLAHK
jgi:hypothetical protein